MAEAAGVLYAVEHLVEGGLALAKGIYDPTLPLKATIRPITDVDLPRVHHSISEVKGRAYVFGGKTHGNELADNAMHMIILPSSGIESTDYQRLEPTSASPPARYGHSAAVIDDQIYIFGGSDANGLLEEKGRVWVFDTDTNSWSSLDAVGDVPKARYFAAATASAQPQPEHQRTDENVAPQLPPDPAKMVPEPLTTSTYGTFVVFGGICEDEDRATSELWTFDIASKTWSQLPSPPATYLATTSPSITFHDNRLYLVSRSSTHYLDLSFSSPSYTNSPTAGPMPLSPWCYLPPFTEKAAPPTPEGSAALLPVTTGQGRNYLLHVTPYTLSTMQLTSSSTTAASLKDRARDAISKKNATNEWAEVRYFNAEGIMIQEGQNDRGIGGRTGFGASKVKEIDGGCVFVWGGVVDGKVRGDGLMIEVEK